MRTKFWLVVLCAAAMLWLAPHGAARQAASADASPIACRALEVHASANPSVTVVVFHQQDKNDQERLASLLRAHSGDRMEIDTGDGRWNGATVFRLKSCFGRGLLLLPPDAPMMNDGATFLLRFQPENKNP